MEDPTTIALNLTFFGTLGVAFVMFLGLVAVFVATLVMAGIGRLAAITVLAIAGGVARAVGTATAAIRPPKSPAPAKAGRKEASQLSADWTAAVERADNRAAARAKAEAAPARKVSAGVVPGQPSSSAAVPPLRTTRTVIPGLEGASPMHAFYLRRSRTTVAELSAELPKPLPGRRWERPEGSGGAPSCR